jgi:hypothetical protein
MEKWTYESITLYHTKNITSEVDAARVIDPKLYSFGRAGWELVSVVPVSYEDTRTYLLYTFKKLIDKDE